MQKILTKYSVAAHLALLAVSPLFLFPFFDSARTAVVILWLCVFAGVWVFFEPSRHPDEQLHQARTRVYRAVICDPLFWLMVALLILAALRWINSGVALAYDVEQTEWHLSEPLLSFFPAAAVGRGQLEFSIVVALTVILMGIRHSLGKSARLAFLFSSSFFAAVAAVMTICVAAWSGGVALKMAKASFADPSFVGGTFAVYALAGIVALVGSYQAKWKHTGFISALSIGGCLVGAYLYSPVAPILLYAAVAVFTFFISLIWLAATTRGTAPMKCFAVFFIGICFGVLVAICVAPDAIVQSRMAGLKELAFFPKKFVEVRETLSRLASEAWQTGMWLGSGLGTFGWETRFFATPADWKIIGFARPAAFNGWWTLLAERGIVGATMIGLPFLMLLFTFFRRIPGAIGKAVFIPACWVGFAALGIAIAENFMDVSFLRPEGLVAVVSMVAIAGAALPPSKKTLFAKQSEND